VGKGGGGVGGGGVETAGQMGSATWFINRNVSKPLCVL
jgi:hypothetical protein